MQDKNFFKTVVKVDDKKFAELQEEQNLAEEKLRKLFDASENKEKESEND